MAYIGYMSSLGPKLSLGPKFSLDNLASPWFRKKGGIEVKRGRKERRTGWEKKEGARRKGGGEKGRKGKAGLPMLFSGLEEISNSQLGAMVTKLEINVSKGEFYPVLHRGIFPRGKYPCSMDFGCPLKPCVENLVTIWKWRNLQLVRPSGRKVQH